MAGNCLAPLFSNYHARRELRPVLQKNFAPKRLIIEQFNFNTLIYPHLGRFTMRQCRPWGVRFSDGACLAFPDCQRHLGHWTLHARHSRMEARISGLLPNPASLSRVRWECYSAGWRSAVSQTGCLQMPLRPPLFDRRQNVRHHFALRLGAEIAFAVDAHANVARFHVARADDEHGVNFRQFRVLDLAVDFV